MYDVIVDFLGLADKGINPNLIAIIVFVVFLSVALTIYDILVIFFRFLMRGDRY